MLRNHIKIALRNLLKNKLQSSILVGGLAIGMAACILLLQYVNYELSFDDFHTKSDRIYRVVNERFQNGATVQKGTITYPTIGPYMQKEYPEVEAYTRLGYTSEVLLTVKEEVLSVQPGLWADAHFFELFDFPLLAKKGPALLDEPNQVVLTKTLADRCFPAIKQDYKALIGETIKVQDQTDPYTIVGICEDIPANSHLQFELLMSYASVIRYWGEGADYSWEWSDFYHYLQLAPGTNVDALEAKFANFSERHFKGTEVSGSEEVFTLQPLSEAHLYSADLEYEIGQTNNGQAVWSLLIIALFILIIAWINYVNLSSVRAVERAKEVGVRKVVGASRRQLVAQFFTEAFCVNLLSLLIALGIVQLLTPWFASNFDVAVSAFSFLEGQQLNGALLAVLAGLLLLGVLLSGAYPAWLLSSSQVSNVLKGAFARRFGGESLRKGLVIFQFTLSIALIAATWLVSNQVRYMSKQQLGVNIDQVLRVNAPQLSNWDSTFIDRMNAFKASLTKFPGVESAATSSRVPGEGMGRIFQLKKAGQEDGDQHYTSNFINTDFEYAKTYGLEPIAGRFFRETDHSSVWEALDKIVISEQGVKMLGYDDAGQVLGQRLQFWGREWEVIGVLPNFHQRSLHHQIESIVFIPSYATSHQLSIRLSGGDTEGTIANIREAYQQFFPGNMFEYTFVDEQFQRLYEADLRFGNILSFFTLLTILIACLGLFGLASYMTFLRTKEIGIRKVLGASVGNIVQLLSKDFLRLVIVAIILAIPLSYYALRHWLDSYAYRVDIPWWLFVGAGVSALLIAFLTVSLQSIKAAVGNPANAIRTE